METKNMNQRTLHNRSLALWPFTLALAIILTGCTVGPNYKRPAVNVPTVYRQPAQETATTPSAAKSPEQPASTAAASLGDEKWREAFEDKELQGLIRTALKNNYDARIAATRVLQAQAQLGITRADQLPSLSVGANVTSVRNPKSGPIPSYELTQGQVSTSAAWNLYFWGRY